MTKEHATLPKELKVGNLVCINKANLTDKKYYGVVIYIGDWETVEQQKNMIWSIWKDSIKDAVEAYRNKDIIKKPSSHGGSSTFISINNEDDELIIILNKVD